MGFALGLWNVEGVQFAASGWLSDGLASRVVGDVVAIDDVVVPVSLALLQCRALESECPLPPAGLAGILGERKLPVVVVPRSEEMYCLAVCRSSEGEVQLDGCHFDCCLWLRVKNR